MIRTLSFIICVLSFVIGYSQNKALGIEQYRSGNYEAAVEELSKVYKKESSTEVYQYLYQSYLSLKEYKKAEKLAEKHYKSDFLLVTKVDIGQAVYLKGDEKRGNAVFAEVIKDLPPHQNKILDIGTKFFSLRQYDWAEKTYLRGKKVLNDDYNFAFELGEVYAAKGQLSSMAKSILSALFYGGDYLEAVQNAVSTQLYGDKEGKVRAIFQEEAQRLAQKNPDETQFMELLIWLHTLENDFETALLYSKSLDKRLQESGQRILNLARTCRTNQRYSVATECYEYLLSKGNANYFYRVARVELVEVLKEELNANVYLSEQELKRMRSAYEKAIEELGKTNETVQLVVGYSNLLAFQFGEKQFAMTLLDDALIAPRLSEIQKALIKVEKADQEVLAGNLWEAVLLYGQVHTKFKEDPIGHEAKLKKAKAYYYLGDFDWAKSQLDVLKGATSKLIANDALVLSVLISDNLGMDTTTAALKIYARADFYYYQGLKDKSFKALDSLLFYFPGHATILDEAYFLKAKISAEKKAFSESIKWLDKAIEIDDLLADEALLMKGKILMQEMQDNAGALKAFEALILNYPGSVLVAQTRKMYRSLRREVIE